MTSRFLCNYFRDEINNVGDDASDGKSFSYKTKILEKIKVRPPGAAQAPEKARWIYTTTTTTTTSTIFNHRSCYSIKIFE